MKLFICLLIIIPLNAQIPFIKKFPDIEGKRDKDFLLQAGNNDLLNFWASDTAYYFSRSTDYGDTWHTPVYLFLHNNASELSGFVTLTGRILIAIRTSAYSYLLYSDNNGFSWSQPATINTGINSSNFQFFENPGGEIILAYSKWVSGSTYKGIYTMKSYNNGISWTPPVPLIADFIEPSYIQFDSGKEYIFYEENDKIYFITRDDSTQSWSAPAIFLLGTGKVNNPYTIKDTTGTVYLLFENERKTVFDTIYQKDIAYIYNDGSGWILAILHFTHFKGEDIKPSASIMNNNKILVHFYSNRFNSDINNYNMCYGILGGESQDFYPPIVNAFYHTPEIPAPAEQITVRAFIDYDSSLAVYLKRRIDGQFANSLLMYDDGLHGDSLAGDRIYGTATNGLMKGEILEYAFGISSGSFYVEIFGGEVSVPLDNNIDRFLFDANKIKLPVNNNGILADVYIDLNSAGGLYDDLPFLFSGGFFISGKDGEEIWTNAVASASRIEDYQPGKVGMPVNSPLNILYVIRSSDAAFGMSWQNWRYAVDMGADFYDGNNDDVYNPVDINGNGVWDLSEDAPGIIGDLSAWCVYNDGVPMENRRYNNVEPKGIEIQQTLFAKNSINNPIESIFFVRYRIINRGTVSSQLDSVYFSAWADPDIGSVEYFDDLAASDSLRKSVYVYNDSADTQWGINPPAVFLQVTQGPFDFIPGETFIDNNSNGTYEHGIDTAIDSAKNNKGLFLGSDIIPGAKNLSLSSGMHYMKSHPSHGDPNTAGEARNYMLGKNRFGESIDPCNWNFGTVLNQNCESVNPLFIYSGNPITNIGWLNNSPQDQRILSNTGPFILKDNEPVDIIVAYVVGRGSDNLNSITKAKQIAEYALAYYNNNFTFLPPVEVEDEIASVENFHLYQNYPNPFNPTTNIKFSVASAGIVTLKVYDILGREVTTLINEVKSPGEYTAEFNGSRFASGVYFYELKAGDFVQIRKMVLIK